MHWVNYSAIVFFAATACDLVFYQSIEIFHAFIHFIQNKQ